MTDVCKYIQDSEKTFVFYRECAGFQFKEAEIKRLEHSEKVRKCNYCNRQIEYWGAKDAI